MSPTLFVIAGLPATGKTTISRKLARLTGAAHLRIDTIEAALKSRGQTFDGPAGDIGYVAAYAIARDLLALGQSAIVDAVHGWPEAELLWNNAIAGRDARLVRVELHCSDVVEHRRRAETRRADIAGTALPDWASIQARKITAMKQNDIAIDTSQVSPADAARMIAERAA